jgi:steroid delta-isomerase
MIGAKTELAGLLISSVLSLFISASPASADSTLDAQNQIRAALEKWTNDFNAGNAQSVCSLFARDLISNYQGQPEGNYDSLCARLKRSVSDRANAYHYDLKINEILVSGSLAAVRLVWTLTIRRRNESSVSMIVEPGLDVFRREADGTWKIARYMSYPLSPH